MDCAFCGATLSSEISLCEVCKKPVVPKTPSDPLIGRVLQDKYLIRKKLGAGGFGAVYEAYHSLLEARVALKTLHPNVATSPQVVERFRREALASSRLQSPYTVKVYDRGATDDGVLWIAMEFIEGETLASYLERRLLSEKETLALIGPVCEALHEAHEKGIIHRDLKPHNIMLLPSAGGLSPKLLDFGIAALAGVDTLTHTGAISGTPKYMAPEQWEGLKNTDRRSDIYSLALITYQCLSGRLPFEADTPLAWMKRHCATPPLDLLEAMGGRPLSEEVRQAVMQGLSKEPEARPQTALAFRDALYQREERQSQEVLLVQSALEVAPTAPVLSKAPTTSPYTETQPEALGTQPALAETLPSGSLPSVKPPRLLLWGALLSLPLLVGAYLFFSAPPKAQPPATPTAPALTSAPGVLSPAASVPQSQPPLSTPSEIKVNPASIPQEKPHPSLQPCLSALQSVDLRKAAESCPLAERESKEAQPKIRELKQQKRGAFFDAVKESLARGISTKEAESQLQRLEALFGKRDEEVLALRETSLEDAKRKRREALLQEAASHQSAGQIGLMCAALKKFLALTPDKEEQKKAKASFASDLDPTNALCAELPF